jgi:hypothetical protein
MVEQVAATGSQGNLKLWDATRGKTALTMAGYGARVVSFSPDGKRIVSGGDGLHADLVFASGGTTPRASVHSWTVAAVVAAPLTPACAGRAEGDGIGIEGIPVGSLCWCAGGMGVGDWRAVSALSWGDMHRYRPG